MTVEVEVEYCDRCGYNQKFEELSHVLKDSKNVQLVGQLGRIGSFEVKINGSLVYSKLATMAFPDFVEVATVVNEVSSGQEVRKVAKQQPITDCTIL